MTSPEEALNSLLGRLEETGYRGLILARAPRRFLEEFLAPRLRPGAYFYSERMGKPNGAWRSRGWRLEDRRNSLKHLGSEHQTLVLEVDEGSRASTIAALADTVVAGGVYALAFPTCGDLGRLGVRMVEGARRTSSSIIIDACKPGGMRVEYTPPPARRVDANRRSCGNLDREARGLLGRLVKWARTCDQARALVSMVEAHRRSSSPGVLVLGDRGRGKSGVLALFTAWLIGSRRASYVPLVSHSIYAVQPLFALLKTLLQSLGWPVRARGRGGIVESLTVPGGLVEFREPLSRLDADVVIVDDAGPLGLGRFRALVRRARFFAASTTVHGYEGGGKVLALRVGREYPRVLSLWLREPVRYPPGDPLEAWLYDVFWLDAEPPVLPDKEPSGVSLECTPGESWALDYPGARAAYGILVSAHYRNNPDDLQLLLETRGHWVCWARDQEGTPLSVAHVNLEDPLVPRLLEDLYGWKPPRVARVVRIATHPRLWGRGLGSRVLARVEELAASRGVGIVVASFSNPDALGFWLRNGYRVVHISPRFNKFTGEKNIVVAKALDPLLGERLECIAEDMRWRLLLGLGTVYWDLEPGVVLRVLRICTNCPVNPPVNRGALSETPARRLRSRRALEEGAETIADLALAAIIAGTLDCSLDEAGEGVQGLIAVAQGRRSPHWPQEKRELKTLSNTIIVLLGGGG